MNPSFSPESLKRLEPTVNRYVEQLINGVGNESARNRGIVEMSKWFHNFSFDVRAMESKCWLIIRSPGRWLWEKISEPWNPITTNPSSLSRRFMELSLSSILLISRGMCVDTSSGQCCGWHKFCGFLPIPKRIKETRGRCFEVRVESTVLN